jgi:hypothetical protein
MGGRAIHKMTGGRMQTLVTRVHLDVHHIPAFELNITDLPFFALFIAFENKSALLRPNQDHNLFAHDHLLCSAGLLRLSETE